MLKDLYDLEDRTLNLRLGQTVDDLMELDLMVESVDIHIRLKDKVHHINSVELPLRHETNGSILIALREIENYVTQKTNVAFFVVYCESARFGAVFHYGNYDKKWTLHGITNGYS